MGTEGIMMADKVEKRETSCFTYEVKMVVQVFAENKEAADDQLEQNGGYVSYRSVAFKDKVGIYSGEDIPEEDNEEDE
jgi:hypothetical protein